MTQKRAALVQKPYLAQMGTLLHLMDYLQIESGVDLSIEKIAEKQLANIYELSRVDNIDYQEEGILMTLTAIPGNLERLRHHLGSDYTEMR